MKKIKLNGAEVYRLVEELYGKIATDVNGEKVLVMPGILTLELDGIARKRLSHFGVKLRAKEAALNREKEFIIKEFAKEDKLVKGKWKFIGEKDSEELRLNIESFDKELHNMLEAEIELEAEMLTEAMLPKTANDYELVFTLLCS